MRCRGCWTSQVTTGLCGNAYRVRENLFGRSTETKRTRMQGKTLQSARRGAVRSGSEREPAESGAAIESGECVRQNGCIMSPLCVLWLIDSGERNGRNRIAGDFFRRGVFDGQRCSRFGRLRVHTAPAIRAALAHRLAYRAARRATRSRCRLPCTAGLSFLTTRARISAVADFRACAAARPSASLLAATMLRCGSTGSTAAVGLLVLLATTLAAGATTRGGR